MNKPVRKGHCGLVCNLCSLNEKCDEFFFKSGCFKCDCCLKKQIDGCDQCEYNFVELDINKKEKVKIRAFIRLIKEYGYAEFCEIMSSKNDIIEYNENENINGRNILEQEEVLEMIKSYSKNIVV